MRKSLLLSLLILFVFIAQAQTSYLLTASRVFDGENMHEGWAVLVKGTKIVAVGPLSGMDVPSGTVKVNYPNATITPGLIEGHSHLLLYPYNITDWDTQVLKETDNYRTARATVHAKNTLMAGFTTARDLGTEGAGYADVALKRAINENIIPGPRLLVAGRAIVSTGSYGPKGYDHDQQIMLGAEPADGDNLIRVIRDQIGKGADFVKIYADYRWGINGEDQPSFTLDELKVANDVITSSGRMMVCHAKSKEAIRRSVLAGAKTIEHGDFIDTSLGRLMKEHGVTYIPTISAVDVISQYRGWKKGIDPAPANVINKRNSFKEALASGVTIGMGGDVGVYPHGENALEMELMVEYGMKSFDVLRAATAVNAKAFRLDDRLGFLKPGMIADVSIFDGNPAEKISDVRKVLFVMKEGVVVRKN
ncbi:MAG: amidohydrolase family protein [Chitinophagaceae bacterium]|jgi:imidazolonepropionase-like amidohydrolase